MVAAIFFWPNFYMTPFGKENGNEKQYIAGIDPRVCSDECWLHLRSNYGYERPNRAG